MAQSTKGVQLIHSANSGSTYTKAVCIKDFPDLDNADTDQVEITTLCDDTHQYIDGLKNLPDELSFTCNYTDSDWNSLQTLINTDTNGVGYWGVRIGDSGKKWTFTASARLVLVGGGVGDALEMKVVLKPKSAITVS